VKIHKFSEADGYVAVDLQGTTSDGSAIESVGIIRSARKILQSGGKELARSVTYSFALLGQQRGGASAGLNAEADVRPEAVTAVLPELTTMAESGLFLAQPGKGISAADVASLATVGSRSDLHVAEVGGSSLTNHLEGVGAAAVASAVAGGLDGRTVVIEGFGANGPSLARRVAEQGGKVVALSTSAGAVLSADGFDASAIADGWTASGAAMIEGLGEVEPAWKATIQKADIVFAGSKMGVISHANADKLSTAIIVPTGPIPVTARAYAMLRRADVAVLPDFLSLAGPLMAMWPSDGATAATIEAEVVAKLTELTHEVGAHERGHLFGAFVQAETFLATWRESLPFGRPLAA
jgi:glutamate dehydrogenase/leucine dehydrogenase